ncbi:rhombosortase [Ideonella sp.]|uniref:rhombosortase n=1 Tax=Ideonella sp. TaxID=1929293 RepID=UPI002B48F6D9|nr:rhombosortase [Ideonella sp.]HJV72217.1 rhombosortase [Ideonella sp.]
MSADARPLGPWAWPAATALAGLGALLAFTLPREALDWQPALALAEPWRALSAAWVHWSVRHLVMNLAGCALLGLLGWRARMMPRGVLAWALAWPLTQFGLLAQPALRHYGGLSGVLHAAAAIIGAHLLAQRRDRHARGIGALLLVGLIAKILWEAPWGAATRAVEGWDFALAPAAHATGALAGLLAWVLVGRQRSRPRNDKSESTS